jgi:hypothetical protein
MSPSSKPAKDLVKGDQIEFPGLKGKEQGEVVNVSPNKHEEGTLSVDVKRADGSYLLPKFENDEPVTLVDGKG